VNSTAPATVTALEGAGIEVQKVPSTSYTYLAFNLRNGPTADVRVRRALCAALDVDQLVSAKFHGLAERAVGMLPPQSWAFAPTRGCHRDLELSRRLLTEAGHPPRADGQPSLTLSYKISTDRLRRSVAVVLQKQALEAGIGLDIRALEFGTFFGDVRKGNFQLMTLKWVAVLEPDLLRGVFSSREIPSDENHFGGLNRGGYRNAEVDAWLDEAVGAPRERRRELYGFVQQKLDEELPYLPLWHESSVCVVSKHLRDYRCSPHGFLSPLAEATEAP
jgi:peptide/nickel transport system substrate-binding protein